MDYSGFSTVDFICDEYFQNWIIGEDEGTNTFWATWLQEHPEKRESVKEAARVLSNIRFREDLPLQGQVQVALAKSLAAINAAEAQKTNTKRALLFFNSPMKRVAAVFIGLMVLSAGIVYYRYRTAVTVIATNYGQIRTIMLPDSSVVTLNAHSSISYVSHWHIEQSRQVTLQGEAFFQVKHLNKDVKHITEGQRFIVHTSDLDVEVLGTTFDVKNRGGNTKVLLKTGKIRIDFKNRRRHDVIMRPGDLIAYSALNNKLMKSTADPEVYTSWADKKLILQDATVDDILQYIEDNYGYKVVLEDTAIGKRKMEGTLLLDNLKDVLFIMSTALDVKIQKEDSTLIISNNK
jgi:ferric-dicitrate binding protein FerR (iron transport regulator)